MPNVPKRDRNDPAADVIYDAAQVEEEVDRAMHAAQEATAQEQVMTLKESGQELRVEEIAMREANKALLAADRATSAGEVAADDAVEKAIKTEEHAMKEADHAVQSAQ